MSFMNLKKKYIVIKNRVGRKLVKKGKSRKSYFIYNTCSKCPLSVYIDVVCNNNLHALVKRGNPPINVLEEAKYNLIVEFSSLTGDMHTESITNSLRNIHALKAEILGLTICIQLLLNEDYEALISGLKAYSILLKKTPDEKEKDQILKRVENKIRSKGILLKEEIARYEKLTSGSENEKITAQYFNEQIITLSKHIGIKITKDIMLDEYAACIKDYMKNGSNRK